MSASTPIAEFIAVWRNSTLKESSGSQSHFNQLCRLLDITEPAIADPHGEWFTFEKGAKKRGGGEGWADVWKKGCFAWEYKGKGKDLAAALRQLQQYAPALENPPLLIVCDLEVIEIHTNFTNAVPAVYRLTLDDLADPGQLQKLKWAFTEPERLQPTRTRAAVTEDAATLMGGLAQRLRQRGHAPQPVAHFMTRLLFCLFAEDIGLLPNRLFGELLAEARQTPADFPSLISGLFDAMRQGGRFGLQRIAWFNGGLFDDDHGLPLERADLDTLHSATALDWSAIEPAIFGTLFERGLDPDKRSQLGAHYTDAASIRRLIEPVIRDPLLAEWAVVKAEMERLLGARKPKRTSAEQALQGFLERLRTFRVLDPACGSGNFLYLALRTLKDIEHQVMLEAEALGLQRGFPAVGPEAVMGIEINPYAAELARLTVWIGEIQWMLGHGYSLNDQPILKPLNHIECRDALLTTPSLSPTKGEGSWAQEAMWPVADAIVGNPPFLGDKKQLSELGAEYVAAMRQVYAGRVPGGADLVCYWFEKARAQIATGDAQRAGLVATNSIRGGQNRKVLERIRQTTTIFHAWSDEPWINEGAAVRVSLVGFGGGGAGEILNGQPVTQIYADLTGQSLDVNRCSVDLTQARRLVENAKISFMGVTKSGPFDISGDLARVWLKQPNPHGKPNSDVLFPSVNGQDLAQRLSDSWIIHFGERNAVEAALYEAPYNYALDQVKPERLKSKTPKNREIWWRFERARPEMFIAFGRQVRYIATSMVAKHRFFVWLNRCVVPENVVIVIARSDDATFGILHSRFHELWALRLGTSLGPTPRYTPTTCFETFPFPEELGLHIAEAARTLNELRENWLNPPEWVDRVPEIVPGYPDRIIPKPEYAPALKKRTLTNLYNQRPTWLINAHRTLDEAVATAYGWPVDLSDEEVLGRLLALNQERAGKSQPNPDP